MGGISPAIPWVVLQAVQPQRAQCHYYAGGGDPLIFHSPTSKSLQGDLCFSLRNEALHDPGPVSPDPAPHLQPQCHSCLSSCPLWPKEVPGNSPFQLSGTFFFFCCGLLFHFAKKKEPRLLKKTASPGCQTTNEGKLLPAQPQQPQPVPTKEATETGVSGHSGTSPPGQKLPLSLPCC